MGWQAQVKVSADSAWVTNALVFATEQEAQRYATDLERQWRAIVYVRVVETTAAPTHRYDNGHLIKLDVV